MNEHTELEQIVSKTNILEYRVQRVEEAVQNLTVIKETVLKWDVRFSSNDSSFLQCPIHQMKMDGFEKRMEKLEEDMGKMKKFVYTSTGALVIISLLLQLVGPMMIDHFRTPHPTKIENKLK
jgi:hypothetical protein